MKVNIYRAKKLPGVHENLYVFVPPNLDIEDLPFDIHEKTGGLVFEKKIDIKPGDKRIGLDTDNAFNDFVEKGYHEQSSKIGAETMKIKFKQGDTMTWRYRLGMRILIWVAVQLFGDELDNKAKKELHTIETAITVTGKEFLKDE